MSLSEKKKKSNEKYLAKFVNVTFRVTPEEKRELDKRAAAEGKSMNQYIKDKALGEKVEHSGYVSRV